MLGIATGRRRGADGHGKRIDKGVVVACAVLAIGVALLARGFLVSVTGDDRSHLPVAVESVLPVPEAAQALNQTSVFVDLIADYTGEFTIDGVTIETKALGDIVSDAPEPGDQVDLPPVTIYESGNATLTFTPSAGAPIEEFADGIHTVELTYWPLTGGRQAARTYTWTFTVV